MKRKKESWSQWGFELTTIMISIAFLDQSATRLFASEENLHIYINSFEKTGAEVNEEYEMRQHFAEVANGLRACLMQNAILMVRKYIFLNYYLSPHNRHCRSMCCCSSESLCNERRHVGLEPPRKLRGY